MAKEEGQIWIGRRDPYIVKYQAGGDERWLQTISTYVADGAIELGQVVALNSTTAGRISPAQWPQDAQSVVGIALNPATNGQSIRVGAYGFFRFDELATMQSVFTTASDLDVGDALTGANFYSAFGNTTTDGGAGNGWGDTGSSFNGIGQPVYWFIGRTLRTSVTPTYSWEDPSSYIGRLTFATPSGYKGVDGTDIPWNDADLDVGYGGLPQVGTVADYEYTAGVLDSLTIHVNITYSPQITFKYPNAGLGEFTSTPTTPPSIEELNIRHGLFPDVVSGQFVPHVDVIGWAYADATVDVAADGETARVYPGFDSYLTSGDRRTEVELSADTDFFYKLTGTVNYTN